MFKKQWLALVVLPLAALIALGARGISNPGRQQADPCPAAQIARGQEAVEEVIDDSLSTKQPALRAGYVSAALDVLDQAVAEGAFVRISAFGGSIAGIKTICETSTRTDAAAPLFASAQATGIKQSLGGLLRDAAGMSVDSGTDIYAALVDAVRHGRALQADGGGPVRVYVWTDGDQAAQRVHLHLLLGHESDVEIAKRIIGNQPVPDARGVAIEIHGIGQTGNGRPASTVATRRTEHIWTLVCQAMHASKCVATAALT